MAIGLCKHFIACIYGHCNRRDGSLCPSRRGLLGLLAQTSKSRPARPSLSIIKRENKGNLRSCFYFAFFFHKKRSEKAIFLPCYKNINSCKQITKAFFTDFSQKLIRHNVFSWLFTNFILFTFLFKRKTGIKNSVLHKLKTVRKSTA